MIYFQKLFRHMNFDCFGQFNHTDQFYNKNKNSSEILMSMTNVDYGDEFLS